VTGVIKNSTICKTWNKLVSLYNDQVKGVDCGTTPTTPDPGTGTGCSAKLTAEEVRQIQTMLNKVICANLTVDGIYGAKTTEAVKQFQKQYGFKETGVIGNTSTCPVWVKLKALYEARLEAEKLTVADIKNLQTMLNKVMCSGLVVDGIYGAKTTAAVTAFQTKYGLYVDGKVDNTSTSPTWIKLNCEYDAAKSTGTGTTGSTGSGTVYTGLAASDVRTLQTMLNKVMNSGLAVDGIYGAKTTAAVTAFQTKYCLTVDGKVGNTTTSETWTALKTLYDAQLIVEKCA